MIGAFAVGLLLDGKLGFIWSFGCTKYSDGLCLTVFLIVYMLDSVGFGVRLTMISFVSL